MALPSWLLKVPIMYWTEGNLKKGIYSKITIVNHWALTSKKYREKEPITHSTREWLAPIIHLACFAEEFNRLKHEYGSDPRSYEHYLNSSENKAWKKLRPLWDLNSWPLHQYPRGHGFMNFFRSYLHYYLSSVHNCEDRFHIRFFTVTQFTYMIFIYLQSFRLTHVLQYNQTVGFRATHVSTDMQQ